MIETDPGHPASAMQGSCTGARHRRPFVPILGLARRRPRSDGRPACDRIIEGRTYHRAGVTCRRWFRFGGLRYLPSCQLVAARPEPEDTCRPSTSGVHGWVTGQTMAPVVKRGGGEVGPSGWVAAARRWSQTDGRAHANMKKAVQARGSVHATGGMWTDPSSFSGPYTSSGWASLKKKTYIIWAH